MGIKQVKHIKFDGSKNGSIVAHVWSPQLRGSTQPYPGTGRWLRMGLEAARLAIATGQAKQYIEL